VDLMNDIHNTFTERFLRVQLVFDQGGGDGGFDRDGDGGQPPRGPGAPAPTAPGRKKRYNALGILEDVSDDEELAPAGVATNGDDEGDEHEPRGAMDVGPAPQPSTQPVAARPEPTIVGAGRTRSLSATAPSGVAGGTTTGAAGAAGSTDWSTVGRNDPCPCGSGKKFKKCHGAHL
jgi:preprotein translocase subunit SecA